MRKLLSHTGKTIADFISLYADMVTPNEFKLTTEG